jgi:diacylglycerol kinase (ATP)
MKARSLLDSFSFALQGALHCLKNERNFRLHFLAAFISMVMAVILKCSALEFLIIVFAIALVLMAEMFNTAIEAMVDIACGDKLNPMAKIAKDVSAGAVFLGAVNACVVGYVILVRKLLDFDLEAEVLAPVLELPIVIAPVCIFLSVMATTALKAFAGKGRGGGILGSPSAHSAVAFAAAVSIAFLSRNAVISAIAFFLAFLLAQSRADTKAETILQVMFGSFIGAFAATFAFQMGWL